MFIIKQTKQEAQVTSKMFVYWSLIKTATVALSNWPKKLYLLFEDEGFIADFAGVVLLSRMKSLVSDNTAS